MSTSNVSPTKTTLFRRLWKPAVVTGASGATLSLWIEEIILFGQEILALIFLPIMAGLVYLLDILIFKSRMPKKEDVEQH